MENQLEDYKIQNYEIKLDELKKNSSYRTIKNVENKAGKYITVDNKTMLNLSSNDYLNVSTNKDLIAEFLDKFKNNNDFLFSSASARLLTGTLSCYGELEAVFAKLYNKESALLFNTGYQCNQGVVSALFNKGDAIFCDKLNHASIVSGLKLTQAEHFRYNHLDINHLEKILKKQRANFKNAIIITESVFSMDGDIAPLLELVKLKKKYNCMLMVDEAHAFGVFSKNLAGVCAELNILDDIDIITVTLGKSLGSMGAMCISKKAVIDYLINKASSFIFSTALPSINILWSNFLLNEKFDFLINQKEKLNALFKEVHKIYPTVSSSQIVPIIIGSAQNALNAAKNLQEKGFYLLPINPPTVPVGTSRLRVSLTADIEFSEIKDIFKGIKNETPLVE